MNQENQHVIMLPRVYRCIDIEELVADYLDGSLENESRQSFDRHLARCQCCQELVDDYQEIIRLAPLLRDRPMPEDARRRFHQALAQELGFSISPSDPPLNTSKKD